MTAADTDNAHSPWPVLPPLADWQDTFATLHMWSQIIGKIRLRLSPPINHFWGCTLYVTTRGLTSSPIPFGTGTFAIDFDFVDHALRLTRSDGRARSFPLEAMPVADFYRQTMRALGDLGISVHIYAWPVEVVEVIPFEQDETHASYDADAVHRFWRALVLADRVLTDFRARFIGKASPSHFFWGAFDLAATRFSGRTAPKHPGGIPNCPDRVMVEAYSHELASPGSGLGRVWARPRFTLTPIRVRPASADAAFSPRRLSSMTRWASSSCPTRPCGRRRTRRGRCFRFYRRPTRPPRPWRIGIGVPWNAPTRRPNGLPASLPDASGRRVLSILSRICYNSA